jgi:DNA-binding beta-propeller fold protein YncE
MLGQALPFDGGIDRAWAAPGRGYALAVRASDSTLVLVRNGNGSLTASPLPEGIADTASVVFSPSGSAAALYVEKSSRIAVLAGLPDAPRLASVTGLPALAGPAAINDDGSALILAAGPRDSQSLYLLADGAFVQLQAVTSNISALRFAGVNRDLLVADASAGSVYVVEDITGTANTVLLSSAKDGLPQPDEIGASVDGRYVFVAASAAGSLTVLDRQGGQMTSIACGCAPATVSRLASAQAFQITSPSNGSLWILDTGGAGPRLLAIPPEPIAVDATGGRQ